MTSSIATTPSTSHQIFNIRALVDKRSRVPEGALWGGWLALSAYFLGSSLAKLQGSCAANFPEGKKLKKVCSSAERVFIDCCNVGGSASYLARWAIDAKVVLLGTYLPLVENLCYSTSLVSHGLEAAVGVCRLWGEKKAIDNKQDAIEKERHKQRLCYRLMKLIADVCMVAWASLGIASLSGVSVFSGLTLSLLTAGFFVGVGASIYKTQIPKKIQIYA